MRKLLQHFEHTIVNSHELVTCKMHWQASMVVRAFAFRHRTSLTALYAAFIGLLRNGVLCVLVEVRWEQSHGVLHKTGLQYGYICESVVSTLPA